MDRAATLSWSESLQQIDDDVSISSQDPQTYHMSSQVEVLRAALKPHFEKSSKLDLEVMKQEVLMWYRVNRDRGFAALEPDAGQATVLGLKMFASLGHIRASRKRLQEAQEQKDQKSKNVNLAVERAVENVVNKSSQANHADVRASVVSRFTGWMNEQLKEVFAAVHAAEQQMSKAEAAVEADIMALVELLHRDHQQGNPGTWDRDEVVKAMMKDVEMQLQALDLDSAGHPSGGETGGTDNIASQPQDGSKDTLISKYPF